MLKLRRQSPIYAEQNGSVVIHGYAKYLRRLRVHKRALLSYITHPFLAEKNDESINRFSNSGLALSWAQVLNELGYLVDVVDWDNTKFIPKHSYDLVVFHGGKNFEMINRNLQGTPVKVHFLTGSYWRFNNQREDVRISALEARRGVKVPRDRYIYASEDPVNETSDSIIVLGDPSMKDTYPKYKALYTINNGSYPDGHFDQVAKDYQKAKDNYLFFAGSGNVHKGLDLLLEVFADVDQHLYIVTVPDKQVLNIYRQELKRPNIHMLGQVPMRTKEFYEIIDKCAFVVLPSCSEGQAGSVVECMNHGLIPIVSSETRLNARKYGYVLKTSSINEIKQVVHKMSSKSPAEIQKLSRDTRRIAKAEHTPQIFRKNLRKLIIKTVKIKENQPHGQ